MVNCPDCYFKRWLKTDKLSEDGIRYWKCGRCGKIVLGDRPFIRSAPRVLYLDIETSLTEVRNYGLKVSGEWMSYKLIKRPFFIICWAALWTDKPKRIYSRCVTSDEAKAGTDKNILAPLWDLMNSADAIAGHNSDQFDIPRITGRNLINGFQKLEKFKTYDTKKMARKHKFESTSLDYLCELFGLPKKEEMPLQDWIDISESGNEKKLKKMQRYNIGDVRKRGFPVYNILVNYNDWANDYGYRRFPMEPKDKRLESVTQLDDIQSDLSDLVSR